MSTAGPWPYVVDGHNDLAWALREANGVGPGGVDLRGLDLAQPQPTLHTDLPRLRRGQVGAQFWSVFVPSTVIGPAAVTATLEQIDVVQRLVARHPDRLALVTTAGEVEAAVAAGRVGGLLGVEGGHCIDESLAVLRTLRALGVAYLTLTHNEGTSWAGSATDDPTVGLSDFGRAVVAEMNRIGMLVDLSHVNDLVMQQALAATTVPVIFSHSSAREVCDIERNVPDDVLRALATNGGVCMVAFAAMFVHQAVTDWYRAALDDVRAAGVDPRDYASVAPVLQARMQADPPPPCTAEDVADHVEHIREVAGLEHVGLGGDYDGAPSFPVDMPDVAGYPRLFEVLRGRGWTDGELAALAHGNIVRVLHDTHPDRLR